MSDFDLVGGEVSPLGAGRPIAAVVLGLDPGQSDGKFTCKLGKRASRGPARCVSREPVEECQGHVDHTLLTELAAPSFAAVLGSASGGYDLCKRE